MEWTSQAISRHSVDIQSTSSMRTLVGLLLEDDGIDDRLSASSDSPLLYVWAGVGLTKVALNKVCNESNYC